MVRQIDNGGLQPRKAHIVGVLAHIGARQRVAPVVALSGQIVDGLAAGIRQPEHPRAFVEALARRVVARLAENVHIGVAAHVHEHGVPAGDGQTQKRRLKLRIGDVVGGDVAADMVDGHERDVQRQRRRLGKIDAHEQRPDQSRRVGAGHGIHVGAGASGLVQRAAGQPRNDLQMAARGDLRHDPAVYGVQIGLRKDLVGQHPPPVLHQRHGRFIAA